jgi:hypothetical protein
VQLVYREYPQTHRAEGAGLGVRVELGPAGWGWGGHEVLASWWKRRVGWGQDLPPTPSQRRQGPLGAKPSIVQSSRRIQTHRA